MLEHSLEWFLQHEATWSTSVPPLDDMPSFLHVAGVRHHESKVSCQGTQHNDPNITGPKPGPLNKECIALITRSQHLLHVYCKVLSLTYFNRQ